LTLFFICHRAAQRAQRVKFSLSLVKPNVWRKLPHWLIWYGTAGTTPMIRILLATEIFYIFATDALLTKVEGAGRGHRDIRHEKAQKFLTLIYAD